MTGPEFLTAGPDDRQLSLPLDRLMVTLDGQMPAAKTYSHSALKTFETCPLQYRFKYVDGIRTGRESIESFMGNRVHEALERLYGGNGTEPKRFDPAHHREPFGPEPVESLKADRLRVEGPAERMNLPELLDGFRKSWDERWHGGVVVVKKNMPVHYYRKRGEECLTRYYNRHEPFDQARVIGVELPLRISIPAEVHPEADAVSLTGVVDRLVETQPGQFEIHDYKTSGKLPAQRDLDRDRQMTLYQIGVRQRFPECREVQVVWHYLVFDKRFRVTLAEENIEWVKAETVSKIRKIENETRFPALPGPLCRWCEYLEVCPDGQRGDPAYGHGR